MADQIVDTVKIVVQFVCFLELLTLFCLSIGIMGKFNMKGRGWVLEKYRTILRHQQTLMSQSMYLHVGVVWMNIKTEPGRESRYQSITLLPSAFLGLFGDIHSFQFHQVCKENTVMKTRRPIQTAYKTTLTLFTSTTVG